MKLKDLQQAIRDQIGAEGPQLSAEDYEARIDEIMEDMTVADLLRMFNYMELD